MSLDRQGHIVADTMIQGVNLNRVAGSYQLSINFEFSVYPQTNEDPRASIEAIRLICAEVRVAGRNGRDAPLGIARPSGFDLIQTHSHQYKTQRPFDLSLHTNQVAEIERIRDLADLNFKIQLWSELVGTPDREQANDEIRAAVPRSTWLSTLRRANFTDVLLIEVPFPTDEVPEAFGAVKEYLIEAQRLYLLGEFSNTISTCRKVSEEIRNVGYSKSPNDSNEGEPSLANSTAARGLSKPQREEEIIIAIQRYAHLASHSESRGGETAFTKSDAEMILHLTSQMVRKVLLAV